MNLPFFGSYTVDYQICREWPTKRSELYLFLFHVMAHTCFGNNYSIFREQLNSF
jgi:hypothetical protein